MRKDLVKHTGVGVLMGILFPLVLGYLLGCTLGCIVAAAKEIRDRVTRKGTPAWDDFLVTVAAVAAGAGILWALTC